MGLPQIGHSFCSVKGRSVLGIGASAISFLATTLMTTIGGGEAGVIGAKVGSTIGEGTIAITGGITIVGTVGAIAGGTNATTALTLGVLIFCSLTGFGVGTIGSGMVPGFGLISQRREGLPRPAEGRSPAEIITPDLMASWYLVHTRWFVFPFSWASSVCVN